MAINQVQFQKGMSLAEFLHHYGTEERCEQALYQARWPEGFRCPKCCGEAHCVFYREGRKYWQCYRCGRATTLISGTIFQATKLSLAKWFLAMYLLTSTKTNLSALELKRHLGVCYRTAWAMKHKLMQTMTEREATRELCGRVEVDDAYLGGERSGGKAGRGSENKVPFIAAVQTSDTGHPLWAVLTPVKSFSSQEVASLGQAVLERLGHGSVRWTGLFQGGRSGRMHSSARGGGNQAQEHGYAVLQLGEYAPG